MTIFIYLFIYEMFYFWPPALFTCMKSSDACVNCNSDGVHQKGRLKPSRYLWIFVSAIVWWRDEPAWPLTARRGGANEMEPERMRHVTELPGFDDPRGNSEPCYVTVSSELSGWRSLSSELIGREVAGVTELSRVLTFEVSLSSPLSLHKQSSTHTTQLFE